MKYIEIKSELDTYLDNKEYIVHCIGSDLKLYTDISKKLNERFNIIESLNNSDYKEKYITNHGCCIMSNKVFNLFIRNTFDSKTTYIKLMNALEDMRKIILELKIKRIVIPKYESGLHSFNWNRISNILKVIFDDLDLEVIVCY